MVEVGQRVQVGEHYGTVRYIGPVSGTEGEWLGVEWEEEGRGKHDGSHKGARYFTCPDLCGSFVRSHKLHPGTAFSDVLAYRYDNIAGTGDEMSIINKDNSSTQVELVGLSSADLDRAAIRENLVMREESIISIGDEEYIANSCQNTINLDMSLNLFYDVDRIISLINLMPKLQNLKLKGNVLLKSSEGQSDTPKHEKLDKIYLAGTKISWNTLCKIAEHFPNISEIYISGTPLHISNTSNTIFRNLATLDLQHSGICEWETLADLYFLPCLNTLILSNNDISQVKVQQGEFANLSSLSLTNNKIANWESVASLRLLTKLKILRIRQNPLIQGPALDMRLLVIAMVPLVTKLNGTPITNNERLQADILYLKHFGADYHAGMDGFHTLHPRFKELVEEYGEPTKSGPQISSIKQQAIMIKLKTSDGTEFDKKLLKTTLVKNVQVIVQRLCKIPPRSQTLFWVDEDDQKTTLDDPTRDLQYYNIIDSCTIYVE